MSQYSDHHSFFDTVKYFFAAGFGATAGYLLFMLAMSLCVIVVAGGGFVILKKYNKKTRDGKETALLKEMNGMQYVGALLMFVGLAPFLAYFIQGMLFSGGMHAGGMLMGQMFGE